jgi:hypothetical protein
MSEGEPTAPQRTASARALPRVAQSQSLLGTFDALDGGVEASGWVFDVTQPERICTVELRVDAKPLARVTASLPRPDLGAARIRANSGFRITLPAALYDGVIRRVEVYVLPENLRIGAARSLAAVIEDHTTYPKTFSVDSILRLQDGVIDYDRIVPDAFLQRHGVRAAVAYAYLWLLKRPPDRGGWEHNSARILAGEVGLGTLLRDLAESEEGKAARRAGIDLGLEFEALLAAAARLPPERRRLDEG